MTDKNNYCWYKQYKKLLNENEELKKEVFDCIFDDKLLEVFAKEIRVDIL